MQVLLDFLARCFCYFWNQFNGRVYSLREVVTVTRDVERNQLLLCFSHACGLRCTELASITIRYIMQPSGLLKSELTLRAEITKNARVRTDC